MVKTGIETAEVGTQEFFDRARARLRFDIPPGLTDASVVPLTGDQGNNTINAANGTTRRSTWMPARVRTVVFFSPCATTSATCGSLVSASISGRGWSDAASRSMSPTVSRIRRSEPAYVHRCSPFTDRNSATISSAVPMAVSMRNRSVCERESSMPWRRFSAVFGPKPRIPRRRPASRASSRRATESMPSSL